MDDYYKLCGRDWGNVGLALGIARTSGKHMRDVCNYYKCYRRHGWNRVLIEIGIRPGSIYYSPFDDRINYHSNCWHEHYCSYYDYHDRHHYHHYKSIRSINIIDIINGMMMIGTMMMAMINIFWKKMQNCCLLVAPVLERKISNWIMNFEFRYHCVSNFIQVVFNLGFAYSLW